MIVFQLLKKVSLIEQVGHKTVKYIEHKILIEKPVQFKTRYEHHKVIEDKMILQLIDQKFKANVDMLIFEKKSSWTKKFIFQPGMTIVLKKIKDALILFNGVHLHYTAQDKSSASE
ncbi:uncharacterized protein EV154DRAFT_486610 [Mucor mucedo]|uniref:uncharacterized protein n=1 Tax=Mucor mucedo TaxID=29922 RepID=UPI00221EB505|nr:uncharacterized protein EV154DRAFT_486610 [Mucor mucedo]KAI7875935.1 hypothetical protein EV154DRAFT_486610 [Mucor mucedo]